jgi:hypothetical protein
MTCSTGKTKGPPLTTAERKEAEGLVDLAEMLSLLKLKAAHHSAARP